MATHTQRLSEIQLHLLRFFSEREVSNEETLEIQRMISQYFAQKADTLMDKIWSEKGLNEKRMIDILNQPISPIK